MIPNQDGVPLLSLIIPYCNAATTIGRTLQSLLESAAAVDPSIHQKAWLQIIAVDNASTDSSTDALRAAWAGSIHHRSASLILAREDSRGVSNARNCGLSHVSGTYIGFVDADDTVASDYFSQLLGGLLHQPDVVHLQLGVAQPGRIMTPDLSIFTSAGFVDHGLKGWWCWSFVVSTDLMRGLQFAGDCYEDYGLIPFVLSRAEVIVLLHQPIYHYARTGAGLTSAALHWRCMQWERQFQLLESHRHHLTPKLWRRVNTDYLHNRLVLRSLAGLSPVLSLRQSWSFISNSGTLMQGAARFGNLFYRNVVALRYGWLRRITTLS